MDQSGVWESFHNPVLTSDDQAEKKAMSATKRNNSALYKENCDVDQPSSFFQLFRFASNFDMLLITISVISATASGVCFPMSMVYFGKTINAFITKNLTDEQINTMRCYGVNSSHLPNST